MRPRKGTSWTIGQAQRNWDLLSTFYTKERKEGLGGTPDVYPSVGGMFPKREPGLLGKKRGAGDKPAESPGVWSKKRKKHRRGGGRVAVLSSGEVPGLGLSNPPAALPSWKGGRGEGESR